MSDVTNAQLVQAVDLLRSADAAFTNLLADNQRLTDANAALARENGDLSARTDLSVHLEAASAERDILKAKLDRITELLAS